jgi:hypothetical protein
MGHASHRGTERARSTVIRQLAAIAAVLVTGLAALATSPQHCPKTAKYEETAELVPRGTIERRYFVSAESLRRVRVVLEATSLGDAELRARVEPTNGSSSDAGSSVRLALTPGTKTSAEFDTQLETYCSGECSQELALIVEHVAGPAAALDWDVVVEAESCDDDFHAYIEKL